MTPPSRPGRAVVTGLGAVTAAGPDVAALDTSLRHGRGAIRALDTADPPGYAALLDPEHAALDGCAALPEPQRRLALRLGARAGLGLRTALAVAAQAWCDAELQNVPPADPDRVALVVAGNNLTARWVFDTHQRFGGRPAATTPSFALRCQDTDVVGAVAEVFAVTGEGMTVGAASASGNAALIQAGRILRAGDADICLVVAPLVELSPIELNALVNLGAMARRMPGAEPPGAPFDATHRGFVPGQAAACIVLESAESAARRGIAGHAELAGSGAVMHATATSTPSPDGEARAMRAALRAAAITPADIGYVNAHGTGSPAGDDAEVAALRAVFGAGVPPVNSSKSVLGHGLCAAGVVEAVATVLQLRGRYAHPNVGLTAPIDPELALVGATAVDCHARYALSNSFGFGGLNTCIVLAAQQPDAERSDVSTRPA